MYLMRMKKLSCLISSLVLLSLGIAFADGTDGRISWKLPSYSIVAHQMSLRECFKTFAAAQGISVVMSDEVGGDFSGEFKDVPSDEFLDRVTTLYNLIWYYDGTALYLYGSGEVNSLLLSLKYMKADEVRVMLQQLGIEDKRFPIRTASNDELILVSGPPRYVALIAETIARADKLREERTFNEIETRIFPLKYTWADDVTMRVAGPDSSTSIRGVASMLSDVMAETSALQAKDVSLESGADAKEGEKAEEKRPSLLFNPIIRSENRLNAVLVRDVVTRMPMYEKLISELDKPQKLIEIVVTKIEMSREDALDWQLSLTLSHSKDNMAMDFGQNAANLASEVTGKGLAGTMSYVGDSFLVNSSLTALRKKGKVRNVSRTSLLTVNNMAARLTDTQSYHARVVGSDVASLEEVTAGTELEVKPRVINGNGTNIVDRMWLSMQLKDGGFETVAIDAMPMTSESILETQALIPIGESILLAGYLRDIHEDGGWGIPYLREIPIIGWLFGGKSWTKKTVQRLFVLTPHVIDMDDVDARLQVARQRDLSEAFMLERDSDRDYATRKEEEARIKEAREIHEENAEEALWRGNKERKLRSKQRDDVMDAEHDAWKKDYEARRKAYKEEKKNSGKADSEKDTELDKGEDGVKTVEGVPE